MKRYMASPRVTIIVRKRKKSWFLNIANKLLAGGRFSP